MNVGPILESCALGHAVAQAIRTRNPGTQVLDRGAYLRVSCAERCVLTRGDVEALVKESFEIPSDLEQIMPSFAGRIAFDDDAVIWSSH